MLKFENWPISRCVDYARNPRKNDHAVDKVAAAIKEFGFRVPIIAKSDGLVVDGHLRLKAAKKLGLEEVPVILADDMTDAQIKAFRLSVNKTAEFAEWDFDLLKLELQDLGELNFDLELTGFDLGEVASLFDDGGIEKNYTDGEAGSLAARYGAPPFSVLDTRQGYWLDLKRKWRDLIGDNGESRENTLGSRDSLVGSRNNGVSLLDPVLAEVCVKWFGVVGGLAFDPFAGDTVFGFVAGTIGMEFHGIELRKEQADLNQARCAEAGLSCSYYCDTSENMDSYIDNDCIDLVFSCPPYADLEVYSDDPRDLSNMGHDDFFQVYKRIMQGTFAKLKDNRFAVVVMGEVRAKSGAYIGTIPKTIQIMEEAGYQFYNEIILINNAGTVPLRAGKYMQATRKVGKIHQNVLVFLKGDAKAAVADLGEVQIDFRDEDAN